MKNRYSVDKNNRLLIKTEKQAAPLAPKGDFKIDKSNRLIYRLNEPAAWRIKYNLPQKIEFIGNWKLNKNHDLEFTLTKTREQNKVEKLVLNGEIISTDYDTLAFEIVTRRQVLSPKGILPVSTFSLLKLSGAWQADEYNRIIFAVKRKAQPDILCFEGRWIVNKNQKITYTYEKTFLKKREKLTRTLAFEGYWQINKAHQLSYVFSHGSNSRFDFRAHLESPNIYPEKGVIKYRLGAGLRQQAASPKIIYLYGAWKFSRSLAIIFQMDYGKGIFHNMEFGAEVHLAKRDEMVISLKNKRDEPLGIFITFNHKFLKNSGAQVLLRLKKQGEESGIEAGIQLPF